MSQLFISLPSDITPTEVFQLLQKMQSLINCKDCVWFRPFMDNLGDCYNKKKCPEQFFNSDDFGPQDKFGTMSWFGCIFWQPKQVAENNAITP